jgi:DNA-binding MarR family transcriptional regulator
LFADYNIGLRYISAVPDALTDSDYRVLAEFRHQLRLFLIFSQEHARAAGLNPAQHQLLLAVRGLGRASPTVGELAERLALKHHSTVEMLDRLETQGLVRRSRAANDRRVCHVSLTARGTRVLGKLSLAHREELGRLGPQLVKSLLALLGADATEKKRARQALAHSPRKASGRGERKLKTS